MPGINIVINKDRIPGFRLPINSGTDPVYDDSFISISKNIPYPHYPVQHWETGSFLFVVEGFFFERADYKTKLERLAEQYALTYDRPGLLKSLFANIDAEFIITIYDKVRHSVAIFNDVLGRYPFYAAASPGLTIFSRNPSFINSFLKLTPNKTAFLATLALGFSIGDQTLYNEIKRLRGGTFIEVADKIFTIGKYHEYNYELRTNKNFSEKEETQEIKSLFEEAVQSRGKFADLNIVALSGGLDSRAVAAAFMNTRIPCRLVSYLDNGGNALKDIEYAQKIASNLDIPLQVINLPDPDLSHFESYFNIKYGLNALDMTFLLNFYKGIEKLSVQPALFTGDGGDKIFPSLKPPTFIKTPSAIVKYAVRANAKMPLSLAAGILKCDKDELYRQIFETMQSYPENDWRYKYVHFIMDNRVANWLVEGEDRNRCFITSFSPFYSVKLFNKLMSVPASQKENFALYDKFLKSISLEIYEIPNANWGFTTSEKTKIKWVYFKQNLKHTALGETVKNVSRRKENYLANLNDPEKVFFENLLSMDIINELFNIDCIQKAKYFNQDNLLNMLTLFKAATVQCL